MAPHPSGEQGEAIVHCPICKPENKKTELTRVQNYVYIALGETIVCIEVEAYECMGCGIQVLIAPPAGEDVYVKAAEDKR